MELKYFVVKEEVQKHSACIEHIRTDLMITNPLNKGLQPKTFKNMYIEWVLVVRMIDYDVVTTFLGSLI